jgi:hypothetical protein
VRVVTADRACWTESSGVERASSRETKARIDLRNNLQNRHSARAAEQVEAQCVPGVRCPPRERASTCEDASQAATSRPGARRFLGAAGQAELTRQASMSLPSMEPDATRVRAQSHQQWNSGVCWSWAASSVSGGPS